VHSLGHVVIKVRDQQRAEDFYHGLLGFPIAARNAELSATFFTLGNHHDFAVVAVGDDAEEAPAKSPGLLHVAFKIGDSIGELAEAKVTLERAGLQVQAYDHGVSKSLYFNDPDANCIEFYVDVTDAWKQNPQLVAYSEPLELLPKK
jgi:catechol 2,3-dioxygenase